MKFAVFALLLVWTAALGPAQTPASDSGPLWVAVGYGGRRVSSSDGQRWENDQRWSDTTADHDDALLDVAYGLGRFIAVGGGAKIGRLLTTQDGRTWRDLPSVKSQVSTIAFGQSRFVAGHEAELLFSTDGETFQSGQRLPWPGSIYPRRSACGDTEAGFRFVLIGDIDLSAEKKRVSWRGVTGDGLTWQDAALDTSDARDIAYGSGHFVVVGPGGLIESSHDGQTWTRREAPPDLDFSRVVWTGSRFLATAGEALWSSPDAFHWNAEPHPIPHRLAWAGDGFPAIGFSWDGRAFSARNLNAWQPTNLPAGPLLNAISFGEVRAVKR